MEDISLILNKIVDENEELVNNWLAVKPGSWGALSGKAIVAVSRHLGRALTESEKRIVWQLMWDKLTGKRKFI